MKPTIRCSSISRVLQCAHSTLLPKEEFENPYTLAGTIQHEIAEYMLQHKDNYMDEINANTRLYIDTITSYHAKKLHIEESARHEFPDFILTGTPDCWFVKGHTLHIFDLKNGENVMIAPNDHQLLAYALLIYHNMLDETNRLESFHTIKTHIVQCEKVETYEVDFHELTVLQAALEKSFRDHSYRIGPSCGWCPSKIHCLKLRGATDEVLFFKDDDAMHRTLKNKSKIEKTLKDMYSVSLKNNPEWFEKKGRNYKQWIDSDNAVFDTKALTPTQALAEGYKVDDRIETVTKYHYVVKNSNK